VSDGSSLQNARGVSECAPVPGLGGRGRLQSERDGIPVIVIDERTLAEFFDEDDSQDAGAVDALVSVLEFETETEVAAYVARAVIESERRRLR
jgi:hypothetical protein